jgi:hypothetical protein
MGTEVRPITSTRPNAAVALATTSAAGWAPLPPVLRSIRSVAVPRSRSSVDTMP